MIENLLRYEPDAGKLIWLVDRPNGVKAGQEAGSVRKDGYRYVRVEDQRYFAQVICWHLNKGEKGRDLAFEYGVGESAISAIKRGHNHAEVQP